MHGETILVGDLTTVNLFNYDYDKYIMLRKTDRFYTGCRLLNLLRGVV